MNATEKEAYRQLKKLYRYVETPKPAVKWQPMDYWGLFDFVCLGDEAGALVQVSSKYFSQRPKEWQEDWHNFKQPFYFKKQYTDRFLSC